MPQKSNDPRNGSWEKELERDGSLILPDCRLRFMERENTRVVIGRIAYDMVYCADCGKPAMGVNPDCPHVFYLCDDCFATKYNNVPPAGTVQIPEL